MKRSATSALGDPKRKAKEECKEKEKEKKKIPLPPPLFQEREFRTHTKSNILITASHISELKENGYTVVEDVLLPSHVDKALELGYRWIEGLGTGLNRNDFNLPENQSKFAANIHGIVEYPSACHSTFAWYARSHPRISLLFSEIWPTNQDSLVTSFDRVNFSFGGDPNKKKKAEKRRVQGFDLSIPSWAHTDQDSRLMGLQCIQGFLNLKTTDASEGGGLFVLKGSHKYHSQLFEKMDELGLKRENKNWVKMPKELDEWMILENKCPPVVVRPVKAGSVVLWDSRAIHANVTPKKPDQVRIGVYVCMVPRYWAEKAPRNQLERKRDAFLEVRGTSHWPHVQKLFSNSKPFRHPLTKDTVYNPDYLNEKAVLRNLMAFLFSENQLTNMKRVATMAGFKDLSSLLSHPKLTFYELLPSDEKSPKTKEEKSE